MTRVTIDRQRNAIVDDATPPPRFSMLSPHRIALVLLSFGAFLSARAASAEADWPDGKGGTFRGEAVQILGPFALFQASGGPRRVLLRSLSDDDCRRFYAETAARPARARAPCQAT